MANQDPLELYVGDERPDWVETIINNGVKADFSSGYTFQVDFVDSTGTTLLTKTTWTTGTADGKVTTVWVAADLLTAGVTATFAAPAVRFKAYLRVRGTASTDDLTVERPLIMKWRP